MTKQMKKQLQDSIRMILWCADAVMFWIRPIKTIKHITSPGYGVK